MKPFNWIYILLLAMLSLGSCEQKEPEVVVRSIPEEDRFIFEEGEPLIYHCSDESADTVWVLFSDFYTETINESGFLGGEVIVKEDRAKITLKLTDSTWLKIIHYACPLPEDCNSCVNIQTGPYQDEKPTTDVYFGCSPYGGIIFAESSAEAELNLNGLSFTNVYSYTHGMNETEGFRMYWSLKYGIIRFEGEIGETTYTWDLEIPG
jgi:hypothetical protein